MPMPPLPLDVGPFERAIARLDEGLARYRLDPRDAQIRDGLVQRFEFTYEISHRLLKRYLAAVSPTPDRYDAMAFQDLVRSANEQGLLKGDWSAWRTYREMRSRTSHAYDEKTAVAVVAGIPDFLAEALFLLDRLRERLA